MLAPYPGALPVGPATPPLYPIRPDDGNSSGAGGGQDGSECAALRRGQLARCCHTSDTSGSLDAPQRPSVAGHRTSPAKKVARATAAPDLLAGAGGEPAQHTAARDARSPDGGSALLAHLRGLDDMQRIALVREGVPASTLKVLANALGLSTEKLVAALGLARATVERKTRGRRRLSADQTERVLGVARLVEQVERMTRESAAPEIAADFVPGRWLGEWLDNPNPALGGERPAALLDTVDGRALVSRLLDAMQAGTYW